MCRKPFIKDTIAFGCGQCMPCRVNKRRLWVHRLLLETLKHGDTSFITLTYSDDNVPPGGTLVPRDTQLWLKRLRKHFDLPIRYFLVGEYGDKSERPHYHVALFGLACLDLVNCDLARHFKRPENLCTICTGITHTWGKGFVYVGTLTHQSASYIAGYVTKKMTNPKNEKVAEYLNGRYPEFARMSLRPGIGALAVDDIAQILETPQGCDYVMSDGDVPSVLQHGPKKMPLGRYLRGKLRERMGMEKKAPEHVLQKIKEEMRILYEEHIKKTSYKTRKLFKKLLVDKDAQKVASLEARTKIYEGAKKL